VPKRIPLDGAARDERQERWSRLALAVVALAALQSLWPRVAAAQDDRPYVVVVDHDMTPAAGTMDLLTVERAIADIEDRWLPPLRFDESTSAKHGLGLCYRFAKWFGLDLPQDHFLWVVGHEVFGHGSRLREVGASGVRYGFDVPIPYGPGGAVTEFDGDLEVTRADVIGIDTGGIEAQNVLADHIGSQALSAGAIHYREAWLYLETRLDGLRYIRSVSPQSPEGHDVKSFLLDLNADCDPPACTPLSASTLKRRALLMLADPMLAYAGSAWAFSYMLRGRTSGALPMIALPHDVRYLPALRFEMTPYGTSVTTEHDFVRDHRLTSVSVGVGDTGRDRAWDAGVTAKDIVEQGRLRGGLSFKLWRQPALDATPNAQRSVTGALGTAIVRLSFGGDSPRAKRTGVLVEAGYKSDGFVRGERLHAGPIVRVGVTFTHR
jgi:hypothetical protein